MSCLCVFVWNGGVDRDLKFLKGCVRSFIWFYMGASGNRRFFLIERIGPTGVYIVCGLSSFGDLRWQNHHNHHRHHHRHV